MKRKMLSLTLIVFTSYTMFGCYAADLDVSSSYFIKTLGCDETKDENIKLTYVSDKINPEEMDATQLCDVFTGEGSTLSEAHIKMTTYSNKDVRLAHTEFILIGEKAAKKNIFKYLDFLSRDYETR